MSHDFPGASPRPGLLAALLVLCVISLGCEGNAAIQPPTGASQGGAGGSQASADDRDPPDHDKVAQDNVEHPFPHRTKAPEFPRDMAWLNTGGALRLRDLQGKFVLLDFWTYCCINCIHILPELKRLERAYPNELVVIGVHSAKFDTEKVNENVAEAILRYEIEHPVVNDSEHAIWRSYGIGSWPSLRVIDPEGNLVAGHAGEIRFEQLDAFFKHALPYYQRKGTLDASPVRFELLAAQAERTPLRFPGKVLADAAGSRLFVSDCNNNRIIISSLEGKLLDIVGTGAMGLHDGGFDTATFHHPQGMALHGTTLYVADTENHVIRKVDLEGQTVTTIAGTGSQARSGWPGLDELDPADALPPRWVGKPLKTALSSPWALWFDKSMERDMLYIAMAGSHQIWSMPINESEIGPYAGNGREDIVDGALLPQRPYELGFSSFAQPSGLTSDGTRLYVADSEGSSIRAVPLDPAGSVKTVVGTNNLEFGRLFAFGDVDGPRERVKMQHCLGVVYLAGKIYVADTYNNKIKVVDAEAGSTRTLAGTGVAGSDDEAGTFDEPAGISYALGKLYVADTNNHVIRTVDIQTGKVATLEITGLDPPALPTADRVKPTFAGAARLQLAKAMVKPVDGNVRLRVSLKLPEDWKINKLAPMSYLMEASGDAAVIDPTQFAPSLIQVEPPAAEFDVLVPVVGDGQATVNLSLNYYYCRSGSEGICKVGSVVWVVPLAVRGNAADSALHLAHNVEP